MRLLGCVLLMACGPSPQSTTTVRSTEPATKIVVPLRVELTATPSSTLSPADVARAFQLNIRVTNVGTTTIDPRLGQSELWVNGVPAPDWWFTVNNGPRDARAEALPPSASLELGYALRDSLFSVPGTYTLVLQTHGVTSPPLTVRVK